MRSARAGFTLIELLAVILIVGILATILVTQLGGAEEAAKIQTTKQFLAELQSLIDSYELEFGDYPPSTFDTEQGVPNDGTNVGVEALVVALWGKDWGAERQLESLEPHLGNVDGDASAKSLTTFESRGLYEITDAWENPIAYFHRLDYEAKDREYVTLAPTTGEELRTLALALRDPELGKFYNSASYQLLSAGPDGEFGTEDDVHNLERR